MNKTKNIILLTFSLISFFIFAACLFVMFFIETNYETGYSVINIVCGTSFWLSLIVGIILQIVLSTSIKRWHKRRRLCNSRFVRMRMGLLSLFSNIPAAISDIALGTSLVVFIVFMFVNQSSIFAYISLSVLCFSFCSHCIFNGRNYYYITNYEHIKTQIMKTEEK